MSGLRSLRVLPITRGTGERKLQAAVGRGEGCDQARVRAWRTTTRGGTLQDMVAPLLKLPPWAFARENGHANHDGDQGSGPDR
jgi:hypothetical protein